MDPKAMKPHGLALADYDNGDIEAIVTIHRDDGVKDILSVGTFFRDSVDINIDRIALDNCRGHVLDIGAGTGIHSLHLQSRGFFVTAIDISPEACNIMRKRGLADVHCTDISEFRAGPFDTLLLLGRSIGMVETIAGLDGFLKDIHRLVMPDGQIMLNSADVTVTDNQVHLAYHAANRRTGRYCGEMRIQFEYKSVKGPLCGWLHIDSQTLTEHAAEAGWSCEVIVLEEDGSYLSKLTKTQLH